MELIWVKLLSSSFRNGNYLINVYICKNGRMYQKYALRDVLQTFVSST